MSLDTGFGVRAHDIGFLGRMTLEKRYDVVVIGAGLVGLASAYFLSKRHLNVLVLERGGGVASECSRGSAATSWPFLVRLREPHFYEIVQKGIESHAKLSASLEYDYEQIRCLWLFRSDAEFESAAKSLSEKVAGEEWSSLSGTQVRELEPGVSQEVACGILLPRTYQGDSLKLCSELARASRTLGVEILTSADVESFQLAPGGGLVRGVRLRDGRSFVADHFVLSAGAWSQAFTDSLGYSIPTIPIKGHMLDYPTGSAAFESLFLAGRIMIRNTARGGVRVGSNRDYSGFDKTVNQNMVKDMSSLAARALPELAGASPKVWTGIRPGTPDGMPLIGSPRPYRNLMIATGHYHEGFTLAPYTGELVSRLVEDPTTDWVHKDLCNPDRFNWAE
jgi:glycine oxidase